MSTAGSLLIAIEIFVVEIDAIGELVIVPSLLTGMPMAVFRSSSGKDKGFGLEGACVIILLLPKCLGDWKIQCGLRFLCGLMWGCISSSLRSIFVPDFSLLKFFSFF